mgnify:CR=1 FL=1
MSEIETRPTEPTPDPSVDRSRERDAEKERMFATVGELLSVVATHRGFNGIRRNRSGLFQVGVQLSLVSASVRWFEDRNLMVALHNAVMAIQEHNRKTRASDGQVIQMVRP